MTLENKSLEHERWLVKIQPFWEETYVTYTWKMKFANSLIHIIILVKIQFFGVHC